METIRAWDSRELRTAGYGAFNAFWAPNRRRIAVTVAYWCSDPCSRIAVIDVRRRSLREITKGSGDQLVRWSKPNELLYHAGVYSRPELSRMTPDGFQRARVRTDLPSMADAIPSPDGQRVATLTRDGSLQLRERGSDPVVTLPRPERASGTDIWDHTPPGRRTALSCCSHGQRVPTATPGQTFTSQALRATPAISHQTRRTPSRRWVGHRTGASSCSCERR